MFNKKLDKKLDRIIRMLNLLSIPIKIEKGNYYYYAKDQIKMLCTEVGKDYSKFIDEENPTSFYQFPNEDMFLYRYIK